MYDSSRQLPPSPWTPPAWNTRRLCASLESPEMTLLQSLWALTPDEGTQFLLNVVNGRQAQPSVGSLPPFPEIPSCASAWLAGSTNQILDDPAYAQFCGRWALAQEPITVALLDELCIRADANSVQLSTLPDLEAALVECFAGSRRFHYCFALAFACVLLAPELPIDSRERLALKSTMRRLSVIGRTTALDLARGRMYCKPPAAAGFAPSAIPFGPVRAVA